MTKNIQNYQVGRVNQNKVWQKKYLCFGLNPITIPQVVYDSEERYIPESILLPITVKSTDNLNLVPKHIMALQSESLWLIVHIAFVLFQ